MIWILLAAVLLCSGPAAFPTPTEQMEAGRAAFVRGAFEEAVTHWKKAAHRCEAEKNPAGQAQALINLAAAYQSLGQQRLAIESLETSLRLAETSHDPATLLLARSSLGAAYAVTLRTADGERLLRESLELARSTRDFASIAVILNNLASLLAGQGKTAEAQNTFEQSAAAAEQAGNFALAAQATGNAAVTAGRAGRLSEANELNGDAIELASSLAPSHDRALILLRCGQTYQELVRAEPGSRAPFLARAHATFEQALTVSGQIGDTRLRSYALGYLGQLAEAEGQTARALELTRQAAFAAQETQSPDALYRWEWQTGRLRKAEGRREEALAAYRRALQTLQVAGPDLRAGYCPTCATFRQAAGPMFFELADLLLQQAGAAGDAAGRQALLREAREVVERLKSVELQDYFGDECVALRRARTARLEDVGRRTAVVYYISLADRLEILVGLSSGLSRFTVPVGAEQLTGQVRQFRLALEKRTTHEYRASGKQLFSWLVDPIRGLLEEHRIDTLVFVPDGPLRTVPMAALHDGEHFLIEKYAMAATPGLTLMEPKPMPRGRLDALAGGLSESVANYPALPNVTNELQAVEHWFHGTARVDRDFVLPTLRADFRRHQFQLVHLATHGQFDREGGRSFLLTHDGKLSLDELEELIGPGRFRGKPVELLALSACQTAAGDDRAALGLGGVAVKAGARSALATLWFVQDQSTALLMSEFYSRLARGPGVTKAKALQQSQIQMLADPRYRHPCYWSPFLLIGNWL